MSAPLIWIALPLLLGILLLAFQRRKTATAIIAVFVCLVLAEIAWRFPIGEMTVVGGQALTIEGSYSSGGLLLVFTNADRPLITVFFGAVAFLIAGSITADVPARFAPLSLVIASLLSAVLAIEPFYYASLLIALSVLISVWILAQPGMAVGRGILRFLVFEIIGLQFTLLGGLLLNQVSGASSDASNLGRATLVFGLGFIFLFAVFPLYVWIPKMLEDAHPYTAVFVFSMVFGISTIFFLEFLARDPWLVESANIPAGLRFVGVLMVVSGGGWVVFQRNLGRILGYAVVIEIGYSLLSISTSSGDLHYAMLAPRILALAVWGLSLAFIRSQTPELSFRAAQGLGRQFPVAVAGLLFAQFSLAGLPLLAGFPSLLELWRALAQVSVNSAILVFLGSAGLIFSGLRTMAVLVMESEEVSWQGEQSLLSQGFLWIGILALVVVGLFPQWLFPLVSSLVNGSVFSLP